MEVRREFLIVFLIVVFLWWIMNRSEGFGSDTNEFIPVGHERYGLRGDRLRRSDISRLYLNPNRHMRLNPTSGLMYKSNKTPCEEGHAGCSKVNCPCNTNEYDKLDTCWNCGNADYEKMVIPPIHPHVPN